MYFNKQHNSVTRLELDKKNLRNIIQHSIKENGFDKTFVIYEEIMSEIFKQQVRVKYEFSGAK